MSSNLYWEPTARKKKDLPTAIKFALRKRFPGGVNITLDTTNLDYLQGLADAGIDGAQTLVDAIDQHECIELTEVF